MKVSRSELLNNLYSQTEQNIAHFKQVVQDQSNLLHINPVPSAWSVLQVTAHLNTYNNHYLPAIDKAMQNAPTLTGEYEFKPGILGNYFVKMMQTGDTGVISKKYKAAKWHQPVKADPKEIIASYLSGQQKLLLLLTKAGDYDIGIITVSTSLNKFITIKLGDTFRFLIAHQQRHFVQITNTLNVVTKTAYTDSVIFYP
ncbi:MAG: hypothetical protein EOP47_20090 [Sphingobacteriaceae bacterium]|nr:MAG: hypothetical protein EOP47_20090 [Sphingobacteriaceae bacterium]